MASIYKGEKGMSPRKAMAGGADGGNFGVQSFESVQRPKASGNAGVGKAMHLEDGDRGTGGGIHHTKDHMPAQAAPDHGPHHHSPLAYPK